MTPQMRHFISSLLSRQHKHYKYTIVNREKGTCNGGDVSIRYRIFQFMQKLINYITFKSIDSYRLTLNYTSEMTTLSLNYSAAHETLI